MFRISGKSLPISRVALRPAGSLRAHGGTECQQGTKAQLHLFCKSSFTFTMLFDVVNSEGRSAVIWTTISLSKSRLGPTNMHRVSVEILPKCVWVRYFCPTLISVRIRLRIVEAEHFSFAFQESPTSPCRYVAHGQTDSCYRANERSSATVC